MAGCNGAQIPRVSYKCCYDSTCCHTRMQGGCCWWVLQKDNKIKLDPVESLAEGGSE